jgi:CRISPR-associated protein Cas1
LSEGKPDRASDAPAALPRPKTLPLITARPVAPPDIVPARMVNEVLYCERLMYLEWVQGEFADNAFTVEGRFTHARADTPGGKLPAPRVVDDTEDENKDEPENAPVELSRYRLRQRKDVPEERPYQARSIWLTSEKLGITAKIDVVEGTESGVVVPIEYKRGAAPDLPEGAYLPERAQVCVQALLLREHGYRCDEGAIYFAKSRQRVAIPLTEALIFRTLEAVRTAREIAARNEAPPPLQDSPKCRGCSLVDICLPDEVNLLRALDGKPPIETPPLEIAAADDPDVPLSPDPWQLTTDLDPEPSRNVRQLVTARDDRVPLYVHDFRAVIALSGEQLMVRGSEGTVPVRLMNTSQVVIRGNAQISTQALRALLERGIPISFLSGGGYFVGRATGHDTNNVDLRMAQYHAASNEAVCLELARAFVVAKIRNSRTMLRRNHDSLGPTTLFELKQLARKAASAESLASLLGLEGAAARVYFQAFQGMLKSRAAMSFDFQRRNRRPPKDPINALLSFTYSLLVKEITIAAAGVGLEPLLGFYHQPRFGRPALALDLMEELRPIVADSVVVGALNTGVVTADDFVSIADACSMKPHARRALTDAFERRLDQLIAHPIFGYRVSYRRVIEIQARLLSRVILGELPTYPPLLTR